MWEDKVKEFYIRTWKPVVNEKLRLSNRGNIYKLNREKLIHWWI